MISGYINSIQSLGGSDGPGVRFVVFLQGCNLNCGCCHNPETRDAGGTKLSAEEIANKAARYREYFGEMGGITLSGGEPLLQPLFAREVFSLCKEAGINTCLDTSGSVWNEDVASLLEVTDFVLLDIKYTNDEQYRLHAGCDMERVLRFLSELERRQIPTVLRQVIIPTLNDNEQNVLRLKALAEKHSCVQKVELLPFKKICQSKYDELGKVFPFGNLPTPTSVDMARLNSLLK